MNGSRTAFCRQRGKKGKTTKERCPSTGAVRYVTRYKDGSGRDSGSKNGGGMAGYRYWDSLGEEC